MKNFAKRDILLYNVTKFEKNQIFFAKNRDFSLKTSAGSVLGL